MDQRTKIVLFNPPGDKIYIRDYYCSKVSKAYYYPQPVDLLIQSAYFPEDEYDITVIDGIAEKKSLDETILHLQKLQPSLIIGLLGSVSVDEDVKAYERIKKNLPEVKIICSGDALLDNYQDKLEGYKWLDAIITNFYADGAKRWFEMTNQEDTPIDTESLHGIACLVDKNGSQQLFHDTGKLSGRLELPIPKQKLFTGNYRMPFANAEPVATVLTNYACPYPCTFCIMSSLPFSTRTASSIIAELKYLKENGYRFIYFSDQTFFQSKAVTREVLNWMIQEKFGISWMCFSRVDVVDEEDLKLMKAAGCKLIMFGVEWADNDKLEKYKKHYTIDQIKETFKISKKLGIKRLGTFLIGVPGQTKESILGTVQFAKDIDADYASFNVAVPRSQTVFREEALELGLIDEDQEMMDQSGDVVVMGNGVLTKEELHQLKVKAYRSFYFRPGYLLKRLFSIRSWTELKFHFIEGYHILKSILKKQ
jgi:anaerobic magnesium-protoporphyrin IX monomethyl ester cyclase